MFLEQVIRHHHVHLRKEGGGIFISPFKHPETSFNDVYVLENQWTVSLPFL
jgi:hypothetical protein